MCPRLRIKFRLIAGTLYGRSTARGRSRLRLGRDRSPLPSARLQGQHRDALGFATFATGRHCLRLGSKGQGRDALGFALVAARSPLPLARLRGQHWGTLDSQLLSYKPFNQFQHFYQYRPEFKISTSLIIGRYQRFPYSTRERPIGRSLVTDPSLLEHMNELYLIQREVPATHREARQHAQTAGFWLHLSSLPLGAE